MSVNQKQDCSVSDRKLVLSHEFIGFESELASTCAIDMSYVKEFAILILVLV
ncbi:MAG: hypothetical protein AB4426_18080 [Xenococcaceae cyanobacterium]